MNRMVSLNYQENKKPLQSVGYNSIVIIVKINLKGRNS